MQLVPEKKASLENCSTPCGSWRRTLKVQLRDFSCGHRRKPEQAPPERVPFMSLWTPPHFEAQTISNSDFVRKESQAGGLSFFYLRRSCEVSSIVTCWP